MPSFFVPLTADTAHAESVYQGLSKRVLTNRRPSRDARLFRIVFHYDDAGRRSRRLQVCEAEVGCRLVGGYLDMSPVLGIFETSDGVTVTGLSDNKMSLQTLRFSPLYLAEKIYFDDFPEGPADELAPATRDDPIKGRRSRSPGRTRTE